MVSGSGVFVFDSSGKDYIDAVSALFCATLGFHNERLIEAATRQMRELPVYPTALNRTVPVVHALADALSAAAPIPDAHVLFATTGSEAIETLIKTTWYINKQRNPKRHKIITRRGSYHGSTIFATRLGGIESIINSFDLTGDDILYAAQPRWPRDALAGETEEDYAHRLARELAELIDQRVLKISRHFSASQSRLLAACTQRRKDILKQSATSCRCAIFLFISMKS